MRRPLAVLLIMLLVTSGLAVSGPATAGEGPAPAATTGRTVIVEFFAGAGCPPCFNVHTGLEKFMAVHTRSVAVALVYHRSIPTSDKLETNGSIARHDFYLPPGEGASVPNLWVDGRIARVGGFGNWSAAQQWFEGKYTGEREPVNESRWTMTADGVISTARTGTVWVNVTALETPAETNLTLHAVVVRKTYGPWNGGNGITMHQWVVRRMLPGVDGERFNISQGQTRAFSYDFNLSADNHTAQDDMAVVALVQSHNRTKVTSEGVARPRYIAPVLQSGYADIRVASNVSDRDDDGVADGVDAFPDNPYEYVDTDGDGMGDNLDPDADGDGTPDGRDAFPLDKNETLDTDRDGTGDNADTDDDGDGVNDTSDAFPKNPLEFMDSDGDGIGDNLDPDDDNDGVSDEEEMMRSIRQDIINVSRVIDLLNSSLSSGLAEVNGSLHSTMSGLGSDFLRQLQGLNASMAADLDAMMGKISTDLAGLNGSLAADITDLEGWLDSVMVALAGQLVQANTSLHEHLDGMEARTEGFYEGLDDDLATVMLRLMDLEGNLSSENQGIIDGISTLANLTTDLHGTALTELGDLLRALSTDLSGLDSELSARLMGIAGNVSGFEASTEEDLRAIDAELERLEKLDAIIGDLAGLDQDLAAARHELDATVEDTSSEEKAKLDVNMALVVLVLVLVAILLVMLFQMRKVVQGVPPPSPVEAREHVGTEEH